VIDGVLSAAAGAAFLLIALLKPTPLAFLVPISDAIVVLGLAAYMIWQPLGMFGRALREVVGEAADEETQQKLRAALEGGLTTEEFLLLDSAVTRLGRSLFGVAYIQPNRPIDVSRLDEIREQLLQRCRGEFGHAPLRMEFIFTARRPFSPARTPCSGE
jgi:predicted Co/Zn/Cd cation transporter (cation efflux family)